MKKIKLTKNLETIVDDQDFIIFNKYKWSAHNRRGKFYATIHKSKGHMDLHIEIAKLMNIDLSNQIDHIDGNSLNNCRNNLRSATCSQNQYNQKISKANKSGYKGVSWCKRNKKWHSYITKNKKRIFIGYFNNKIDAAKAYNEKAKKIFGEYARLNIIESQES